MEKFDQSLNLDRFIESDLVLSYQLTEIMKVNFTIIK